MLPATHINYTAHQRTSAVPRHRSPRRDKTRSREMPDWKPLLIPPQPATKTDRLAVSSHDACRPLHDELAPRSDTAQQQQTADRAGDEIPIHAAIISRMTEKFQKFKINFMPVFSRQH